MHLEEQAVARSDGKGSYLGESIGASLKDDQKNPNRGCQLLENQTICHLQVADPPPVAQSQSQIETETQGQDLELAQETSVDTCQACQL